MSDPASAAGERWLLAAQTIRGGFAVKVLAAHITWMLGDNDWKRPVWRERAIPPDGKTFETVAFDQYLLLPEREGLDLQSLLTVHKLCEADPKYGAQAIAMLRREIPDYEERIGRDCKVVLDNSPKGSGQGARTDLSAPLYNVKKSGGNRETYLAARLKRDAPDEWRRYMDGDHRSVRAAALSAGIVKPTFTVPGDVDGVARTLRRRFTSTECSRLAALLIGDPE